MADTFRAKSVAEQLGVSVSTVRAWSNEFAPFLTPSAQAATTPDGTPVQRRYTEADLAVLAHVKRLLDQNATFDEVRRRLAGMTPEELAAMPAESDEAEQITSSTAIIPTAWLGQLQDAQRLALAAKDETISELRARVADLAADKERLQREIDSLRASGPPALPPPEQPPTEPPPVRRTWRNLWPFSRKSR